MKEMSPKMTHKQVTRLPNLFNGWRWRWSIPSQKCAPLALTCDILPSAVQWARPFSLFLGSPFLEPTVIMTAMRDE